MNHVPDDSGVAASRSPLLMDPADTAIVIIDVQTKLLPHIRDHELICWNIGRLVQAAEILNLPRFATEQYPAGLGATVSDLKDRLNTQSGFKVHEKRMFSCRECSDLLSQLNRQGVAKILLVGIEAHVCVLQSALDLIGSGFDVYVAEDAIGSRFESDKRVAVSRLETSGATMVTTEMAMFEWCKTAEAGGFRQISRLVREPFKR